MTVTLNPILQRLAERRPIPVMARGILERCLNPAQLDAWFQSVAEQQYTRTLLFSSLFDLGVALFGRAVLAITQPI
jgi:hypothetical protein